MKKNIILLCWSLTCIMIFNFQSVLAQDLGQTKGNAVEISSSAGNSTFNNIKHKVWLYRNADGDNWLTTSVHDGISVDGYFLTPQVDTRTWWLRDPINGTQSWGNENKTFMGIYNGKVGIGTEFPNEKLAVNGNVSVNGKIGAKEVKVEAKEWPDYVFDDNHKILSLVAVAAFIKTHKHLPEMPAAKEVEENGVQLGEMNKLLVKKVEELTLHLIEQDKKMNAMFSEIKKLKRKK